MHNSPEQFNNERNATPKPTLNTIDVIAVVVGIVIGAGIFRTPSLVAGNVESASMMLTAWVLGGIVSLIGALCYAELTTAFPNTGGDYHFLRRSFGDRIAFLFAWARMSVVQTGSIALLSFIIGDYVTQVYSLGTHSSVIYAGITVIGLTAINIIGLKLGTATQKTLTAVEVLGVCIVIVVGFFFVPATTEVASTAGTEGSGIGSMGLAMVFVLLTFGGWNEAAYLSGELRSGQKMVKALVLSLLIITGAYILVNLAFLRALGLEGMANSTAVAGDLMEIAFGESGLILIAVLVAVSALTSVNATIFTGARSNYALGRDFRVFSSLGKWNSNSSAPVNAFLVQGGISLILISFGLFSRSGFETMIDYTAPVFWFFFLLVGISLFILRVKEPNKKRPFRVPFYPITPIIFCLTCCYLLYSSVMYTGWGALVGICVLLAGVLLLLTIPVLEKTSSPSEDEH